VSTACPFWSALASGSGFPWGVHVRPQRKKLLAGGALYGVFDFPVACDERQTKRGEHRAATMLAAFLALDGCAAADAIDLVHEILRPLVGHVHSTTGG
jgi:hypothetical protein